MFHAGQRVRITRTHPLLCRFWGREATIIRAGNMMESFIWSKEPLWILAIDDCSEGLYSSYESGIEPLTLPPQFAEEFEKELENVDG